MSAEAAAPYVVYLLFFMVAQSIFTQLWPLLAAATKKVARIVSGLCALLAVVVLGSQKKKEEKQEEVQEKDREETDVIAYEEDLERQLAAIKQGPVVTGPMIGRYRDAPRRVGSSRSVSVDGSQPSTRQSTPASSSTGAWAGNSMPLKRPRSPPMGAIAEEEGSGGDARSSRAPRWDSRRFVEPDRDSRLSRVHAGSTF
jgi:hypothetical protein